MLRLSMFFLICALSCGVFGFGSGAAPSWMIARGMFFVCFMLAVGLLAFGTLAKPASWETLDHKRGAFFG